MTAGPPRPRRVAVVAHSRRRIGGVESYLGALVPALAARGAAVACWFETAGAGGDAVVAPDAGVTAWVGAEDRGGALQQLAAWKPDVVYTHGLASPAIERAIMRLAPAVVFAHSYYGTCVSGTKSWQVPVPQPCQRTLGAGCLAHFYPRRCGGWNPVTLGRQYRLQTERLELLRGYARILVASRHMAEEYTRHGLGPQVRVVPLPVEPARLPVPPADRRLDDPGRPWRLLFLGRFETTKGAHIALDGAALVAAGAERPVRLQLSGEGSLRARLVETAAALMSRHANLHVEITPWLSSDAAAGAIDDADLLLVPSLWPEPFGLVGVEAARRGVPAIAFDVGGIGEWLSDGVTGTLVPRDRLDARAFADAITRTLADHDGWLRLCAAAPDAARRFEMPAHLRALDAVFDEAAAAAGRAA